MQAACALLTRSSAASAASSAGKITCRWPAMRFTRSRWIFWWRSPGIAATCGLPACGISQRKAGAGSCHRQRRCRDRMFHSHSRAAASSSRTRNGSIRVMPLPSSPAALSLPVRCMKRSRSSMSRSMRTWPAPRENRWTLRATIPVPDVFQLTVDRRQKAPAVFRD